MRYESDGQGEARQPGYPEWKTSVAQVLDWAPLIHAERGESTTILKSSTAEALYLLENGLDSLEEKQKQALLLRCLWGRFKDVIDDGTVERKSLPLAKFRSFLPSTAYTAQPYLIPFVPRYLLPCHQSLIFTLNLSRCQSATEMGRRSDNQMLQQKQVSMLVAAHTHIGNIM